jgi:hypothetical protein
MAASLDIRLADQVRVLDLNALLACAHTVYTIHLSLESATTAGRPLPTDWSPEPHQDLWIAALEIGTPNWLKLWGEPGGIAAIAAVLTLLYGGDGLLGGPKEPNGRERAEIHQIQIETQLQELELLRKLDEAFKADLITEQQYNEKRAALGWAISRAPEIRRCVPSQPFEVVNVDEQDFQVDPPGLRDEVTTVLAGIGQEGAVEEVLSYLREHRAHPPRDLQGAYRRLAHALRPMSDSDIHELIAQLLNSPGQRVY